MTTERQIAANRRNAQKSTGPRTARGKAASSRNNARHGLYSISPVIPGLESETAWEHHRLTTVTGLAPATALEEALAERVALILWRLRRVARYEQTVTAEATDKVQENLTEKLARPQMDLDHIRAEFSDSRRCLRAFDRFLQRLPDAPMTGRDAAAIVDFLATQIKGFDYAAFELPGVLRAEDSLSDIPGWTVARVRLVVDAIATSAGLESSSDDLIQRVVATVRAWYAESRAAYRKLNRRIQDARQECVLPAPVRAEYVVRYETHLTRLLNQTLSQLRQVQRHREAARHRPAYNDEHAAVPRSGAVVGMVDLDADSLPLSVQERDVGAADVRAAQRLGGEVYSGDSNPDPAAAPPSEPPPPEWHSAN